MFNQEKNFNSVEKDLNSYKISDGVLDNNNKLFDEESDENHENDENDEIDENNEK